jgi:hypothetical protein
VQHIEFGWEDWITQNHPTSYILAFFSRALLALTTLEELKPIKLEIVALSAPTSCLKRKKTASVEYSKSQNRFVRRNPSRWSITIH